MTIRSKAWVLMAEDKPDICHAMNFPEKGKNWKSLFLKTKKASSRETFSAVTKEMSRPRVAMSARTPFESVTKN